MSDSNQTQKSRTSSIESVQYAQTLLTQIQDLEYSGDRIKHRDKISALQQQYNASIARISPLICSHLPDLLEVLPTELWLYCMEEVMDDNSMNLLPLTLVSRRWRNNIISSPSLWTHIYVRDNPDYTEYMQMALHLSRDLPLSVTMELPFRFPIPWLDGEQRHPILRNAYRIKYLTVRRTPSNVRAGLNNNVGAMDDFYDSAQELIKCMDELPALEFITLNHGFDYYSLSMTRRFSNTPRLKGVKFWCITAVVLNLMGTCGLEYLSSSSSLESLYAVLPQLPRLRRLIMTQAGEGKEDSLQIPQVDPTTLPPLEVLEFYQSSPRSIYPFLTLRDSPLRELQAKLSWAEFRNLAPLLSNLSFLRYLHVILKAPSPPLKGFEILLPILPHISRFELEQQPPDPDAPLSGVDRASLASLLDACRTSMTQLHTFLLSLQDEVPINNLLAMVASIHSIRKFEFKGPIALGEEAQATAPHLEEVILADEGLLSYLQVPNAEEIYIAKAFDPTSPSPSLTLEAPRVRTLTLNASLLSMVDGKSYPELVNLTWIDPTGGCASIARSFHSLTKICFDYGSPRKECNDFCELLLRYPYSCRSLNTMEMRAFPEWDILLHMLRRRNFLPGQGVSLISTIKIPGYPGLSLLVPMTELLGGKIPAIMPSIAELSLSAVDGPYFDVNVPGCEDCIDCRMTCGAPFDRHSLEILEMEKGAEAEPEALPLKSTDTQDVKPLEGSDPPLPGELLKWFDGWSSRRRIWYAKWNRWDTHTRRKGACERHDYSDLVSITSTLLHDIPYFSHVLQSLDAGDDPIGIVPVHKHESIKTISHEIKTLREARPARNVIKSKLGTGLLVGPPM